MVSACATVASIRKPNQSPTFPSEAAMLSNGLFQWDGSPFPVSRMSCLPPPPSAMGYKCVCTTGTVWHKVEVQSNSQREKLSSDMS